MYQQPLSSSISYPVQRVARSARLQIQQLAKHVASLEVAVSKGEQAARAELAWFLLDGRDGIIDRDRQRAYELVAGQNCVDCEGVLARCLIGGYGVLKNVREGEKLAEKSAQSGSKYGQYIWGWMLEFRRRDKAKANEYYEKASSQGLDFSHIRQQF